VAQQLKSLLDGNHELRPLLAKTQVLSDLQRDFAGIAPACFAQSSQVLNLQSGILSIAVGNGTMAAKLRQLAPELVIKLQNKGCEVSGIRVRVQVSFNGSQPKHEPRKLGVTAQNALNEFSHGLEDTPLKLALIRMLGAKN
jgi:hypothetical protein